MNESKKATKKMQIRDDLRKIESNDRNFIKKKMNASLFLEILNYYSIIM